MSGEKSRLRQEALEARRAIRPDVLLRLSRAVEANLASWEAYGRSSLLAAYVSKDDEVQTRELIARALAEGKRVAVPLVDGAIDGLRFVEIHGVGDLAPGRFGILEPRSDAGPTVPLSGSDLVLVPLVAWDERGHRIGYGRGYYDRALAGRGRSLAVGLALESQRVARVPEGPGEGPLDAVVTESRVLILAGRQTGR
ncbi:MAG: 5-formyltetrahydrofolate cyclo-ligase [Nitrososphaerales archaeon]